jgi:protein involved in sex pheromone biosynthesis
LGFVLYKDGKSREVGCPSIPLGGRKVDWEDFHQEFKEEFCPAYTDIAAITHLKSTSYFQNKHSINEYLDKFLDLVSKASYTDNKTIVVKFHRGLNPCI